MTYQAQPGTIPHRVIEFLRSKSRKQEFSTAQLADALGCDKSDITHSMDPARNCGAVKTRRESGLLYWRLGNGIPPAEDLGDDDKPAPKGEPVSPVAPAAETTAAPPAETKTAEVRKPAGQAMFGFYSDNTMTIAKGDDIIVLDLTDMNALNRFMRKIS